MLEHLAVHEFLMVEKAQANPNFEAQLATLPSFPVFPNGFIPKSAEHQTAVIQGAANRGEEVIGIIPGEDKSNEINIDQ